VETAAASAPDELPRTDYATARRRILAEIGPEAIRRLHRPKPALDRLAIVTLPLLFITLMVAIAQLHVGLVWWGCFVLQGFVIQLLAYAVHDLFVHRGVGGRGGYWIGVLFDLPLLIRLTWFGLYHQDHHAHLGTRVDPETYKQDLDTRWKRALCLTAFGIVLAYARRLKPVNAESPDVMRRPIQPVYDPPTQRQLRRERLAMIGAGALVAMVAVWSWRIVLFGYLLPLLVVTPVASMLRVILEHAEATPGNVFHSGTFYRTGFVTRPLFFWDAGDCHVVHHLYPAIPFYRMGEALSLLTPILKEHGARERRSLVDVIHGYFVRNEPHRSTWSR
jgi:fatty acid desaturase